MALLLWDPPNFPLKPLWDPPNYPLMIQELAVPRPFSFSRPYLFSLPPSPSHPQQLILMAAAAASSPSCTKPPIKIKPIIHRLNPSSSLRFFRPFSSSLPSPLSISHPHQSSPSLFLLPTTHKTLFKTLAVVEEEAAISAEPIEAQSNEEGNGGPTQKPKVTPCELYICNIPRSCDISELFEVFKPYGTVQSVEVTMPCFLLHEE